MWECDTCRALPSRPVGPIYNIWTIKANVYAKLNQKDASHSDTRSCTWTALCGETVLVQYNRRLLWYYCYYHFLNFSTNITLYFILFLTTNAVIYLTIKIRIANFPPQVKFLKNIAGGRRKEKDTNEERKKERKKTENNTRKEKINERKNLFVVTKPTNVYKRKRVSYHRQNICLLHVSATHVSLPCLTSWMHGHGVFKKMGGKICRPYSLPLSDCRFRVYAYA